MVTVIEKVRFYETDLMGIAHHSNHIRWFECGRCAYLKQAGLDLTELLAEGISYPIKSVSCEYIEPVRFDEVVRIETILEKLSRAQMVFSYRLIRDTDNTLLATGTSQNVFTYKETGRVARLSDTYYKQLKVCYDRENKWGHHGGTVNE